MAAMTSALRPALPNRRGRVRHKIQTPAYATFTTDSPGGLLDLYEIVDISEEGVAIQCHSPLETNRRVNLCLDLAECEQPIYTAGQVIWANAAGRAGLRFSILPPASLFRLREWLFLNAMAGIANAEADLGTEAVAQSFLPRPDYTDTLAAVTAVQREVESLGADLAGALHLIAARAQTLVRASGSAIALATADPNFMDCRASSGPGAPPVGARLQVGSGFSGECVQTGQLLRCDDTELDPRVDAESCRALGIRSILAAPVRVGEKSIGILEVFSAHSHAFLEADSRALQRLAETVLAAVNRAARAEDLPTLDAPAPVDRFAPTPGSVLFASPREAEKQTSPEEKPSGGITLPLSHLITLVVAAVAIFFVLGYSLAPWIQTKLQQRGHSQLQTVFASSPAPQTEPASSAPTVAIPTVEQLRQNAEHGDAASQYALGLRYATGDDVKQDENQALNWFTKAAEQGNISAQAKVGDLYLRGRGIPKNYSQAYFWMALARTNGDENSKALATVAAKYLTREQIASLELDADRWRQQHPSPAKPEAGH